MKILALNLLAYGPFTGLSLDLSGGHEGFQLFHGPNEAGKSTTLRALQALFYGLPPRSPDNFLHAYEDLRLGARLRHSDGSEIEFIRRKGSKNTLLDSDQKPLGDSALQKYLGGVSEDLFATLFGINHEQLVLGAQNLLKGHGEVGESLFAAGLGGANLRSVLEGLENEANDLFKPQGQNQLINRAIREYGEAKSEAASLSLSSKDFDELENQLNETTTRKNGVRELLRINRIELNRLERIRKSLPLIAERKTVLVNLLQIGDVVILPATFTKERTSRVSGLESARLAEKRALEKIEELRLNLQTLCVPDQLLARAGVVTELHQRLGGHRKAAKDLPGLQGKLNALETEATKLLHLLRSELSLAEVEALRLSRPEKVRIQNLASQHQSLEDDLKRRREVLDEKQASLEKARQKIKTLAVPRDPTDLKKAVRLAQKEGDAETELARLLQTLKDEEEQMAGDLKRLGLWTGSIEELASAPMPPNETIDRFESEFARLDNELAHQTTRLAEAGRQTAEYDRSLKELRLVGAVPSEEELEQARQHREIGWQLVRQEWIEKNDQPEARRAFAGDASLPATYEASVRSADDISDRLRREADRVARQATLKAHHDQFAGTVEELRANQAAIRAQKEDVQRQWITLWAPLRISPYPPKEMRSWIRKQAKLVEQAVQLNSSRDKARQLRMRLDAHRARLRECLGNLGEKPGDDTESLEDLLDRSQVVIESSDKSSRQREQLEKEILQLETELRNGNLKHEEARTALARWETLWRAALVALHLPENASTDEVNAVIADLETLFNRLDEAAQLASRIKGINDDATRFAHDVAEALSLLAPDLLTQAPEQAVAILQERLTKANQDAATLKTLDQQRRDVEQDMENARRVIRENEERLAAMCGQARCAHYAELEAAESTSAQVMSLRDRVAELEKQLLAESGGLTVPDFIISAETETPDDLPGKIAELNRQIEDLEQQRSALENQIGGVNRDLQAMDGNARAAAAAGKAQNLLAQIQEHSERYVRVRLAWTLLRREIERYRSENQDPLLRRAGELFRELTLGSFASLATDFDEQDNPVLKGIRPSSERIGVEGMSDGTRDQLYLALRLASLEKHLQANEPMPFIVDDILINFDDRRAQATLAVMGQISQKTQVLFFTHHSRLVDLARRTIPAEALTIHELGAIS